VRGVKSESSSSLRTMDSVWSFGSDMVLRGWEVVFCFLVGAGLGGELSGTV